MARMVPCCTGCSTTVVPRDDGAQPDGGAICPKCGAREPDQIVRRPATEVDGR
jgi:DNA-directed RNA polymerase subunit RPC12/RpoP